MHGINTESYIYSIVEREKERKKRERERGKCKNSQKKSEYRCSSTEWPISLHSSVSIIHYQSSLSIVLVLGGHCVYTMLPLMHHIA